MTDDTQPEALRLEEEICNLVCSSEAAAKTIAAAADELCRLHAENASLRAQQPASPPAEQQATTTEAALGVEPVSVYAKLPEALLTQYDDIDGEEFGCFAEGQMRDFADRTHALRMEQAAPKAAPGPVSDTRHSQFLSDVLTAAGLITHGKQCKALGARLSDMVMRLRAAPQQEAQEPALFVSPKQLAALTDPDDPEGEHGRYLPARKTSKGLFTQPLYTAPQPSPAPQGVSDAMRVPLDSLHADAAYLIGRLQLDTMDGARVVEIIRERIEAAKAALAAQAQEAAPAAQGDARAEQSLLKVLTAVQRYLPPDGPSAKDTLSEIIGIVDARAVLAKWGAPQPVARKPMDPDVLAVNGINARIHFRRGWCAAEAAHGIGTEKGDSNGLPT